MSHKSNVFALKMIHIVGSILIITAIAATMHPAYSEQAGRLSQSGSCEEHGIDKSRCFICDPSLREKGRLWCKEHRRYEDRCWVCHPDLKEKGRLFCEEHGLYEDECIFCHPETTKRGGDSDEQSSQDQLASQDQPALFCKEHKVSEQECGICHPELATELNPGQSMMIRFSSRQSALKAGLRTALPLVSLSSPTIETFCEVKYNENKLARITPLASGVIQRVLVDVGDQVKAGDILVEVNSAEIAEAKASFLSAIADVQVKEIANNRKEKLVKEKISAAREYQEAKASYDIAVLTKGTARQRLLNYGFTDAEIEQIKKARDSSSFLAVRAPFHGTLVDRAAVVGEVVNPGNALFTLADLKSMWLELSIPEDQSRYAEQGQNVEATFDSRAGVAKGQLIWVATSIDERSRMLKARAVIPNDDGKFKSGMFGKAEIETGQATKTFRIPKDAIQRLDGKPYLFVKEDADLFALRRIVVRDTTGSEIDVLTGINETDQIVIQGSFIVMSEFLKSRLGAGCTDG